jgi:hypothetical protein
LWTSELLNYQSGHQQRNEPPPASLWYNRRVRHCDCGKLPGLRQECQVAMMQK